MTLSRVLDQLSARWLAGAAASVVLVAGVTAAVAVLERHVAVAGLLVLYLLAVLPVAIVWGARLAALTSVLSIVTFAFFFLTPIGSLAVADSENLIGLGVFLVTAVVVAQLAARSRRAALESVRLTEEQSALRRVATLVAESASPTAVFEAVTREVGLLCDADLARMERYEPDGTVVGIAAWSRDQVGLPVGTRFELDGPSVAREIRRSGVPVRLETFTGAAGGIAAEARALGIRSSVGCPVVVAGSVWGVVAASTKRHDGFPPKTEAQIAAFTELVATAVENAEARAELRRLADEQGALRRVATLVARGVEPDRVFAAVAAEIGTLFAVEATALIRLEPQGKATFLAGRGWPGETRPGTLFDLPAGTDGAVPAMPSVIDVPILVEGRVWGAIKVASRRAELPPHTESRISDFTELIATAISNTEARSKLTQSRARIMAAADQTRRRIERDLHDGAQQRLVSLALDLRVAESSVPAELPDVRADIGRVADDLTAVLDELRELSHGVHPAVLSKGGLGPALRALAGRSPVPVEVVNHAKGRYPPEVEVAVYYVVAEALTNTAKHADASRVDVTLEELDSTLRLHVGDDGIGGVQPDRGSGLVGLRDRVDALGGTMDVTSPVGHGTAITISLPIDPADRPPAARDVPASG
ncbi:GAF domain-containing protein [Kribbella steppae]|uniref:GAF domain-containing protein n=1 Tax=Kribbella steppae TaxID=2512223 RepID=A0A4R2H389_9ACTN|nr:DUF4118 domain-containing protein [Kribbella steppae]TCO19721.1 GAF domain-containing protein [Kribbella steppae]